MWPSTRLQRFDESKEVDNQSRSATWQVEKRVQEILYIYMVPCPLFIYMFPPLWDGSPDECPGPSVLHAICSISDVQSRILYAICSISYVQPRIFQEICTAFLISNVLYTTF